MTRWLVMFCTFAAACDFGDSTTPGGTADACQVCAATATCDPTAANPGSCGAGFAGDGTSAGTGCSDVDECAVANACDAPHATCTNTVGSFTCACAAGFTGDGKVTGTGCADIDECTAGTNDCDTTHGTCANTDGSFTCGCASGFTGDGTIAGTGCTDVNECAAPATTGCDSFACVNTPGSYQCQGLYAIEPFEGVLARLDPKTFELLDLTQVTSSGIVTGVTAMTRHPTTGTVYAVAKVNGVTGRGFGTLDLETGVFSVISSVDRFSSLEFTPDGTLYGMTGAGASVSKTLYTIDLATGTPTLVAHFGNGADGEVICYDTDSELWYHWTSGGSATMESFGMAAPATRNSLGSITGLGEVFGCRYVGNHTFLMHDINSHVRYLTAAGVMSTVPDAIAALFQDVRATLPTAMTAPHTVRPISGPAAGGTEVTIRGIGLTGTTSVKFDTTAAASFTVVDDTTITAVAPALAAGTVNVTTQSTQPYPATWPAAFTFVDPPMLRGPSAPAAAAAQPAAPAVNPAFVRKALRGRML